MKKLIYNFSLVCGMLLTLAAFPVFGQTIDGEINKRPLRDFGRSVKEKIDKNEVDLTAPFSIELQGTFDEQGKLDPKTVKFTKSDGDREMIEIANSGVGAMNGFGILDYLSNLGAKDITISIEQTKDSFSVLIKSSFESPNKAKPIASAFKMMLDFVIGQNSKNTMSETELMILENTKAESAGNDFLLKFSMPSEKFRGMIKRELEKVK